jgi:hypothetical protein
VGPQETHVLVARVCVPHSLGVTVRIPASADGSVASSFAVFFPTVGVPLFIPARARYKLANLALDDPLIREIPPSAVATDARGDAMELEHKSGATSFEHITTPGPLVVLDVFVMDHNDTAFPPSKQPAQSQHAQQSGDPAQLTSTTHAASSAVTAAQRAQQERADRALQLRLQEEEHQAAAGYGSGDDGDDGAGGGGGSDAGASEQSAAPRRRISAREANEREDFAPVVRPKRKYVRSAPLSGGSTTPNAKRARMHAALLSNAAAMGQPAAAAAQRPLQVGPSASSSSAAHSAVVPPAQDVPSHSAQPREDDGDDGKSAGGD